MTDEQRSLHHRALMGAATVVALVTDADLARADALRGLGPRRPPGAHGRPAPRLRRLRARRRRPGVGLRARPVPPGDVGRLGRGAARRLRRARPRRAAGRGGALAASAAGARRRGRPAARQRGARLGRRPRAGDGPRPRPGRRGRDPGRGRGDPGRRAPRARRLGVRARGARRRRRPVVAGARAARPRPRLGRGPGRLLSWAGDGRAGSDGGLRGGALDHALGRDRRGPAAAAPRTASASAC